MKTISVLDHGYVALIEPWGTGRAGVAGTANRMDKDVDYEVGIIEAARQSTQGSFRGWDQDAKLLRYLYEHKHLTPFEFSGMVLEVQAPIFVFREWHRHRTQSYNEMSARYAPLPDLYYLPTAERVMMTSGDHLTNKQAQSAAPSDMAYREGWLTLLEASYSDAEWRYQEALKHGIPKELARLVMPVGHYSKMRASANLRCWLQFLTLRMDPAAQWEIRQYANAVNEIVMHCFPHTYGFFTQERLSAQTQS